MNFTRQQRLSRTSELLVELGIDHVANSKSYTLSGGERRRVEIARALATSPSFMLLDEPFAGIDPIAVTDIQTIIAKLRTSGIGVLITDHNVRETLKITDRAYIINNGEIFRSGSPFDLSIDPEVRKVYLGETFKLD
jgi:lipopolysaccharide export system ATP-binding protein